MEFTESTIGAALKFTVSQWAISFPMAAVWIVGILFAFVRWRRNPKVSLLVLLSCGLSLLVTLVMPVVQYFAITLYHPKNESIPAISMAISFVWTCLAALSSGLLIYAALVDRPEAGSRFSTRWDEDPRGSARGTANSIE